MLRLGVGSWEVHVYRVRALCSYERQRLAWEVATVLASDANSRLRNARTEVAVMNRCAQFPASRRARPCLRVRQPARLPLASELRLRTATQCMTETHTGLRPRTPGRALGAAGKWPARLRRASSVTAFELPRDITNTSSRGADVASSQRLDARGATEYERRSLFGLREATARPRRSLRRRRARPQRPRPQTGMRLEFES
jgi:hypothetical protein